MSHQPFNLETHEGFTVMRDDLLPGGSKTRFLRGLVAGQKEVVFGGPFCGGAPVALSVIGKELGIKITVFYAQRKELYYTQRIVQENGGNIVQVPMGFMSNVQAKAKAYAAEKGALFLPLGFDTKEAVGAFVGEMKELAATHQFDEIWCATGSGMLGKCLGLAFPAADIIGIQVGLSSRNEANTYGKNVHLFPAPYTFDKVCKTKPPFPSNPHYDAKAWELLVKHRAGSGKKILFWNVLG